MSFYIYLLKTLLLQYENAFKIGCTGDYSTRLPGYGGYLGEIEYEADVIEIKEVPYEIKSKYRYKVDNHRLCNYAEAYLHDLYKSSRVTNPTSNRMTEFFNSCEKSPNIDDIIIKLKQVNIIAEKIGKYDKMDHLQDFKKEKTKSKTTNREKRVQFEENNEEEERIQNEYFCNPYSFITNMILNGFSKLRQIQDELWNTLKEDPDNINGIIQWPTGTGKRIAIIMVVIVLYIHYKKKGKNFRCVIAANRNDIFQGDAWNEYQLIKYIGLKVYKGHNGELSKLDIKDDESFLLVTTHQSLIKEGKNTIDDLSDNFKKISKLKIDCMVYDETQNITSSKMYDYLIKGEIIHLIGVSATPKTDDEEQNKKITKLFHDKIISNCSYQVAIENEYINPCEYNIYGYDKDSDSIEKITNIINRQISSRIDENIWFRKKFIIWIPENNSKKDEYIDHFMKNTNWKIFKDINDKSFESINNTENPWCLVLCQKGREGYDRKDIEFGVSIGNSATHLYIQEQGRSQRKDYDGKKSELLIFTDKEKIDEVEGKINEYMGENYIGEIGFIDDITIEDDNIENEKIIHLTQEKKKIEERVKQLEESLKNEKENQKKEKIRKRKDEKETSLINHEKNKQRKEYSYLSLEKQYEYAKKENRNLKIIDDNDYKDKKVSNLYYQDNPTVYFEGVWKGWYDFLEIPYKLNLNDFKAKTQNIWKETHGNYQDFTKKCKLLGYPYFDYIGLYGKTIDDIHRQESTRRR